MVNTETHYGLRSTKDALSDEGRREVARAVLVPDDDELDSKQIIFELETYINNRGIKKFVLYIDKMNSDDRRTKTRITDETVNKTDDGLLFVKEKGSKYLEGSIRTELGQFCKNFSERAEEFVEWDKDE